jgi:hypothetical protein
MRASPNGRSKKAATDDNVPRLNWRGSATSLLLGAGGGFAVNLLTDAFSYRVVAGVAAGALALSAAVWLRGFPPAAPLVRYSFYTLSVLSLVCAILSVLLSNTLSVLFTAAAAGLTLITVLIASTPAQAFRIAVGAAAVGGGVASISGGVVALTGGLVLSGISLTGVGVALTGIAIAILLGRIPLDSGARHIWTASVSALLGIAAGVITNLVAGAAEVSRYSLMPYAALAVTILAWLGFEIWQAKALSTTRQELQDIRRQVPSADNELSEKLGSIADGSNA